MVFGWFPLFFNVGSWFFMVFGWLGNYIEHQNLQVGELISCIICRIYIVNAYMLTYMYVNSDRIM